MGLIALAAFIFWDGLLFKIIYGLVALLALAELLANYHIVRLYTKSTFYVILECLMTIFALCNRRQSYEKTREEQNKLVFFSSECQVSSPSSGKVTKS